MATPSKYPKRKRAVTPEQEIGRLRSQVARLQLVVRKLRAASHDAARTTRLAGRFGKGRAPAKSVRPAFPSRDAEGNYPAADTLRVILARQIIQRREAACWTQAELAAHAGVRQETLSRIESGKNAPNVATVDKIDRALRRAELSNPDANNKSFLPNPKTTRR